MILPAALLACAVNVAPLTLDAIVRVESGGNPVALHVNHLAGPQPQAADATEAAAIARRYIAAGYSVDLGIMQLNSRNLSSLGYTIETALDPCSNIAGGAEILSAFYGQAAAQYGEGQPALLAALSAYNTGDFARGFANGYVSRVVGIPAITLPAAAVAHPPPNPYTAPTKVYSRVDMRVSIN